MRHAPGQVEEIIGHCVYSAESLHVDGILDSNMCVARKYVLCEDTVFKQMNAKLERG